MDVPELGIGPQASAPANESGVAPSHGAKRSERLQQQRREAKRRYYLKNKATINAKTVQYRRDNRDRIKPTTDAWRDRNRDRLRAAYKRFHAAHRDRRNQLKKEFNLRNRDKILAQRKEHYQKYKSEILERNRQWRLSNPDKMRQKDAAYLKRRLALNKERRASNPTERLKDACRTRVGFILRKAGIPKFDHTFELVGCTPDFFKSFIESQLCDGMTWDNYGEWEIDHVIPIKYFDISDVMERRQAFHYSNCKPLWQPDNRSKCDSSPGPHQPLLV